MISYFLLFVFQIGNSFLENAEDCYHIFYTCQNMNGSSYCENMDQKTKDNVYENLTYFFILKSIFTNFICIIVAIIINRFEICRKKLIQLSIVLKILHIICSVCFYFFKKDLIFLPLIMFPFYVSNILFETNIFVLILTRTQDKNKSLFVCELLKYLGIVIGIQSGKYINNYFTTCYIIIFILFLTLFLLSFFLEKEKTKIIDMKENILNFETGFLLIGFFLQYLLVGEKNFLFFYTEYRFNWSIETYMNFKTFQTLSIICISIFNIFFNNIPWYLLFILGILFDILCRFLYLFVNYDMYLYFGCVLGSLGILKYYGLKFFMLKKVSETMYPKLYIIQLCIQNISLTLSISIYGHIFKYSKDIFILLSIFLNTLSLYSLTLYSLTPCSNK